MKRALAYARVSSHEQGKSGYGLQSQEAEIKAFAHAAGYKITRWEREVASAKGGDSLARRPGLRAILDEAKRRSLPVLISRLDRLSRDAAEIEDLARQSGVEFICVRTPEASDGLVLKVQAKRIERETQMLSERTKAGLKRAKLEGRVLGNTKNLAEAQKKGAATNSQKAELRRLELAPVISKIQASGRTTATAIADALNQQDIPTPSGRPWTGPNVRTILRSITASEDRNGEHQLENPLNDPEFGIWG